MSLRLTQGPLMQQLSGVDLVAYKVTTGATSFYAMNAGHASTELDLIGSKDLSGSAGSYGGSSPSPIMPGGATFNGTSNGWVTALTTFDMQQDWTIGIWFYMGTATSNHTIFCVDLTSSPAANFKLNRRSDKSNNLVLQLASSTTAYYAPTSGNMGVSSGAWHHMHLWRDYSTTASVDTFGWRIDNGTATTITRSSISGSLGSNLGNHKFGFGARPTTDLRWVGNLLHATMWEGKVLSASEQDDDYTVESTGVIP